MMSLPRNDNSYLTRWWWTVDRLLLTLLLTLMVAGLLVNLTASPPVAATYNVDSLYFFKRQMVFSVAAVIGLLGVSMMSADWVRRMAAIGLPLVLLALVATLVIGDETKGATRWIDLGIMKIQPSEFLKPLFIVFNAWLLSACFRRQDVPSKQVSFGLFVVVVGLLVLQPDFGQTVLISAVWLAQLSLAGLPLAWLLLFGLAGLVALGIVYSTVPYFASRIDRFINPDAGDTYQPDLAIKAFETGGMAGRGLGEGQVKIKLPDAHSDYVFAVVGEELGALVAALLLIAFAGVVLRGMSQLMSEEDPFKLMAAGGLLMQFGLQVSINAGVAVGLLPSKGMTLPFVSYGGSSTLALALGMGMVLALTRRNPCLEPRLGLQPLMGARS